MMVALMTWSWIELPRICLAQDSVQFFLHFSDSSFTQSVPEGLGPGASTARRQAPVVFVLVQGHLLSLYIP